MPGELSTVGANIALDAAMGRATQTARTMYLALLTSAPTDATTVATMVEYAATGYSRQACAMGAPTGDPSQTKNTGALSYGPITGANGTTAITHCALVSSASGTSGDLVAIWAFTTSKTPGANDTVTVAANDLVLNLD